MAKTINSALEDLLKKAQKKVDNKQMSNKALANMKSIFDAGSAMTVLMNKVLGRKYEHFYEMTNGLEEILETEQKKEMIKY